MLRKVKAARTTCILIKLTKILKLQASRLNDGRERMIKKNRILLSKNKMQRIFKKLIRKNYPFISNTFVSNFYEKKNKWEVEDESIKERRWRDQRDLFRYVIPSFRFSYFASGK